MNPQLEALMNAHRTSSMETFNQEATKGIQYKNASKFAGGLTYAQACELRMKCPEEYEAVIELLKDSAFD